MSPTWTLEDVTEIAKEAPYTFYLPSNTVISQLKVGSVVKLMFSCDVENENGWSAERMWVEVKERDGDDFKGILDNDPYYIPDLKAGDLIEFKRFHILQTDIDETEPDIVEKYLPRCFVTDMVLNDKKPVRHLFREKPSEEEKDDNYSGWTISSGLEDDEYMDDSKNWNYVSLGAVLNIDDRFKALLNSEYNTGYAWNEDKRKYEKI